MHCEHATNCVHCYDMRTEPTKTIMSISVPNSYFVILETVTVIVHRIGSITVEMVVWYHEIVSVCSCNGNANGIHSAGWQTFSCGGTIYSILFYHGARRALYQ